MRRAEINRKTAETDVKVILGLDGQGKSNIQTGCGFLDHMLTLFAHHGNFDLDVSCQGDTHVDYHHSVEDIGICLGQAFREALADRKGIARYADITLPMDEALVTCAVDISGRSFLVNDVKIPSEKIGDFDTELFAEFLIAFVNHAGVTLHFHQISGANSHHIVEGCFKAMARTLAGAVRIDPSQKDRIPSTKGVL